MMLRRFVEVYMTEPCQPIANVLAKYKTAGLDLLLKCDLRPGAKANCDVWTSGTRKAPGP
jgi:hypothetical protein